MELVQQLMGSLNVQEDQAKGGAGMLFQLAKDKLGDEQFAQLAQNVPGLDGMLEAAPETGGGVAGALGGLAGSLGGGKMESLGNLAQLAGGFSKLGMDQGMVGKFIPIVLSFVQSQGGDGVKDILAQVLK